MSSNYDARPRRVYYWPGPAAHNSTITEAIERYGDSRERSLNIDAARAALFDAIDTWTARETAKAGESGAEAARAEAARAKIVSKPQPKRVECGSCHSTIEYLPEGVERHSGTDYSGGPDGYERVKCPRLGCPGHGYIRSW